MSSDQVNSPQPETVAQAEMDTDTETDLDMEGEPEVLSISSVSSSVDETAPSTSRSHGASGRSTEAPLNGCVVRIKRELQDIRKHPPPNCTADLHYGELLRWTAGVNGPAGSVYEGGHFRLDIRFPGSYPFRPPRIRFTTRIYHCNVDSRGSICLDVLGERWSPVMDVAKVLLSIYVLMSECNPDDPLVMCIADQYKTNRREHDKIARQWTKMFAMTKAQDKKGEKVADQQIEQNQELNPVPSQQENQQSPEQ